MVKAKISLQLTKGDEVRIIKGEKFYATPCKVTFIKEYPNSLSFEAMFDGGKELYGIRKRTISISKPSLHCGDAVVQRVKDGAYIKVKVGEHCEQ